MTWPFRVHQCISAVLRAQRFQLSDNLGPSCNLVLPAGEVVLEELHIPGEVLGDQLKLALDQRILFVIRFRTAGNDHADFLSLQISTFAVALVDDGLQLGGDAPPIYRGSKNNQIRSHDLIYDHV